MIRGAATDEGRERGVALLLVIWIMALLSVVALAITRDARTGARLARNLVASAQAQALADGGVWWALARMEDPKPEAHLRTDGTPYRTALGGAPIAVSVEDEGGKIDLNQGDPELLAGLFRALGYDGRAADGMAAAIAAFREDWQDRFARHGASALPGTPAAASDHEVPFDTLEDLRRVPAIYPERYRRIAPFLTVNSGSSRVNPRTARREVLLALPGIEPGSVDEFLAARRAGGGEAGPGSGASTLAAAARYLVWSAPQIVTIRSLARLADGTSFLREAQVDLRGEGSRPFRVLAWRQGRAADEAR